MAETTRPVVRSLEWVDGMAQRIFSSGDGDGAIQCKVANVGVESRQCAHIVHGYGRHQHRSEGHNARGGAALARNFEVCSLDRSQRGQRHIGQLRHSRWSAAHCAGLSAGSMNDAKTPKVAVENRPRTAWLPVKLAEFSPLTPLQATHSTGSNKSTKADSVKTRFKV